MSARRTGHPLFARFYARVSPAMDAGGIAERRQQLREIRRVLSPGGQLRFLEHVRADTPALRRFQHFLDATIWPALYGGCHTGRDTAAAVQAAGFTIEQLDRFRFPEMRLTLPMSPHLSAIAFRAP